LYHLPCKSGSKNLHNSNLKQQINCSRLDMKNYWIELSALTSKKFQGTI
jgi:hypothetical protein